MYQKYNIKKLTGQLEEMADELLKESNAMNIFRQWPKFTDILCETARLSYYANSEEYDRLEIIRNKLINARDIFISQRN